MGLLWDMFKTGVSSDEVQMCIREVKKIWNEFSKSIGVSDKDFKGISLYKDSMKDNLWILTIQYMFGEEGYLYKECVSYDMARGRYYIDGAGSLHSANILKIKGYVFNVIRAICIPNKNIEGVAIVYSKEISITLATYGSRKFIVCNGDIDNSFFAKNIKRVEANQTYLQDKFNL